MKKILFQGLIMLSTCSVTFAQALKTNADYGYDANGNRISASVIYLTTNLKSAEFDANAFESDSILATDSINIPKDGWNNPQRENIGETEILVYPNPTHGKLIFQLKFSVNDMSFGPNDALYIWDLNGKEILKKAIRSDYTIIDMSQQQNGTYMIEIRASGVEKVFKIIKN